MKKTESVRLKVLKAIDKHGALKPREIITYTKAPPNQVYTAIAKLVSEGRLRKNDNAQLVFTDAEDDIPAKSSTTRKATALEMTMGKKIQGLESQVEELQRTLHQANVKYFDAMAVIKYLEAKLISLSK